MANYRDVSVRARETATFRFTDYEKRLLSHLAELQNMTQTALIRALLAERADQLGIVSLPEPAPKRGPGRPKKVRPDPDKEFTDGMDRGRLEISERIFVDSSVIVGTIGGLIVRFQEYFSVRGEKMQHELESTVRFVTGEVGGETLLSPSLPLLQIDDALLTSLRERLKDADIRFPKKNLHLTYLRMMFNFGVKEGLLNSDIQPMEMLRPFTAKEVADAFPLPVKTL